MTKKRVNFPIEENVYKRLKMLSVEEGLTIGETIEAMLRTISMIAGERKEELRGINPLRFDGAMKDMEYTTLQFAELDSESYENFKKYIRGEYVLKNFYELRKKRE